MLDVSPDPEVAALRDHVATFVRELVIPAEPMYRSEHGREESLRRELQEAAWAAGVFASQVPTEAVRRIVDRAVQISGSLGVIPPAARRTVRQRSSASAEAPA